MQTQELNIHVKYTRPYMTTGAFHEFPEGTKCIQFEVTGDDVVITIHAYFQPDGERFFRIVSDTFKEKCMCYTSKEINVVRVFMNWLAENRDNEEKSVDFSFTASLVGTDGVYYDVVVYYATCRKKGYLVVTEVDLIA